MSDNPAERLKLFRKSTGLNQRDFAKELAFSPSRIGMIESGSAQPSRAFLERISSIFKVSADWLLHGRGDMLLKSPSFEVAKKPLNPARTVDQLREAASNRREAEPAINDESYSFIGSFEITDAPFPGNIVMTDDIEAYMAFSRAFLERHSVDPDRAGLIRAKDDNMEPFAPDGSRALVDFTANERFSEGLHIFRYKGSVQVRQLLPIGGGADRGLRQVVAFSINPTTTSLIQGSDLDDLEIIGRVVTVISDM